jgi:hypothetical protein
MRAEIAFYRGDYRGAAALQDEADRIVPGSASFQRAVYAMKTGDRAAAIRHFDAFDAGLPAPTPMVLSHLELQRGIAELEYGRLDQALARFRKADAIFPGNWLVEEHVAEVTARKGDRAAARRLYEKIVSDTGHPEYMDALAALAGEEGKADEEKAWRSRAATAWQKRLAQFPEAAVGHALDHCAQKGDWPARWRSPAITIARARTATARSSLPKRSSTMAAPGGEGLIEKVLASPWRTAQLHAVAQDIYRALGTSKPPPPSGSWRWHSRRKLSPRRRLAFSDWVRADLWTACSDRLRRGRRGDVPDPRRADPGLPSAGRDLLRACRGLLPAGVGGVRSAGRRGEAVRFERRHRPGRRNSPPSGAG